MSYLAEVNVVKPFKGTAKVSDRLGMLIINGNGRYDDKGVEYTADIVGLQKHFTDREAADSAKKAALLQIQSNLFAKP